MVLQKRTLPAFKIQFSKSMISDITNEFGRYAWSNILHTAKASNAQTLEWTYRTVERKKTFEVAHICIVIDSGFFHWVDVISIDVFKKKTFHKVMCVIHLKICQGEIFQFFLSCPFCICRTMEVRRGISWPAVTLWRNAFIQLILFVRYKIHILWSIVE